MDGETGSDEAVRNSEPAIKAEPAEPNSTNGTHGKSLMETNDDSRTNGSNESEATGNGEAKSEVEGDGDRAEEDAKTEVKAEVEETELAESGLVTQSPDTESFRLVCETVEDLRKLCQQFHGCKGKEGIVKLGKLEVQGTTKQRLL